MKKFCILVAKSTLYWYKDAIYDIIEKMSGGYKMSISLWTSWFFLYSVHAQSRELWACRYGGNA